MAKSYFGKQNNKEEVRKLTYQLQDAIDAIMSDDKETDKAGAVIASIEDFKTAVSKALGVMGNEEAPEEMEEPMDGEMSKQYKKDMELEKKANEMTDEELDELTK